MKRKIQTNNKSYSLKDSPLFKITHLKRLQKVLNLDSSDSLLKKQNYRIFQTKTGREVQEPIGTTCAIHNRIASLLSRLQSPDYMHSGIKGLSYQTNALTHKGFACCLTMDIQSFFAHVSKQHIFKFFRNQMQCSHNIANLLADVCTVNNHLPTGSQLSMPLAYWANSAMFNRLYKLASSKKLIMTVYVDDLTFSGEAIPKNFLYAVTSILKENGYTAKEEKTRIYLDHKPREITGLIIKQNEVSLPNRQYRNLHQQLNSLGSNPTKQEVNKLMGTLNFISMFDCGYQNVLKNLKKQLT